MAFRSLMPFNRPRGVTRLSDNDPFSSLRQEMDRMLEDFTRGWPTLPAGQEAGFLSPMVDVSETDKGIEITAELPGVKQDDIDVELNDDVLTLRAERKEEREEKDEKRRYHLSERSYGTFLRRFQLPYGVEQDKVQAKFEGGVLKVFLPRSQEVETKAKKIDVKGS